MTSHQQLAVLTIFEVFPNQISVTNLPNYPNFPTNPTKLPFALAAF